MTYKVFIPTDVAEAGKEYLRAHGCEVVMASSDDEETVKREIVGFDAILPRIEKVTKGIIDAAGSSLKVIARHGVGVDNVDIEYATSKGIWVTNGPTSNINSVAEAAIMLMLMCSRNTFAVDQEFRNGTGDYSVRYRYNGCELQGKTLGLIGLGKIGTLVAKKAYNGFGMKVMGYDEFLPRDRIEPFIEFAGSAETVLREADYVSIHIPALPSTKNFMGTDRFKMMKKTAFFINCARGEIMDEEALREALTSGQIRGAGLDCFQPEPPAPNNSILTMRNVVCTPHNAAHTQEALDRMSLHAAIGIVEVLSGQKPSWPVNKPKQQL